MFCDNSAINEMNPGMAGFLVAKKRMVELNGGMQQGIVYLLGAGPGDPGLITVRGRELLGMAEVTPGTTSKGMPASCRASASSPPRPKT